MDGSSNGIDHEVIKAIRVCCSDTESDLRVLQRLGETERIDPELLMRAVKMLVD